MPSYKKLISLLFSNQCSQPLCQRRLKGWRTDGKVGPGITKSWKIHQSVSSLEIHKSSRHQKHQVIRRWKKRNTYLGPCWRCLATTPDWCSKWAFFPALLGSVMMIPHASVKYHLLWEAWEVPCQCHPDIWYTTSRLIIWYQKGCLVP